jgi:hypothetical protein
VSANNKQIGGEHYRGGAYQHWDWVADNHMDYFQGCSTKYVSRWRSKNGMEDLLKAQHYVHKKMELLGLTGRQGWERVFNTVECDTDIRTHFSTSSNLGRNTFRFAQENELTLKELEIIWYIAHGEWPQADSKLADFIAEQRAEAGAQSV